MKLENYGKWITLAAMDEDKPGCFIINDENLKSVVQRGQDKGFLFVPSCHYLRLIFKENGETRHEIRADKKDTRWDIDMYSYIFQDPFHGSFWCPVDKIEPKLRYLFKEHFFNW